MALAMEYDYVEKHITLSRNNRNFDWQVSLYPEEFTQMVQNIKFYSKALGKELKHPDKKELAYRDIIYKKVKNDKKYLQRNDQGSDFLNHEFASYDKDKVGIALIARLKSQRLKKKVLKSFCKDTIIEDLYSRLKTAQNISSVFLATSNLEEDQPLVLTLGKEKSFKGHPISVLDRMLSLSRREKYGAIFRVTGDNPFTDPTLIDKMVELYLKNDLDYVRANNVPFGVSGELFSTRYLWNLYLNMSNPLNSEYLSWFVLNDENSKKGCINFIPEDKRTSFINLSIDYPEDYKRALSLLERIKETSPEKIKLSQIISKLDLNDLMDENKFIKLPEGSSIKFRDYLDLMNNIKYTATQDLYEEDIYNW
jgi:spore coat polysaccharide biosynthesis protein SpsF